MRRILGSLERSLALLNAIADGISARDKQGQLFFVNEALARMSGYPSAEAMLAVTPSELADRFALFDEQDTPVSLSAMPGHMALRGKVEPERIVRTHDRITGEDRWSAIKAQPVYGESGEVEFAVTITRDITAQKKQQILQEFLIAAGKALASSLDYKTTLANVAKLVTPKLADWCAIDLLDEQGGINRVAVAHVDPAKVAWAYELHQRYPPKTDSNTGVGKILRTGQTEYYPTITDEMLIAAAGSDNDLLAIAREIGFRASAAVPLTARGHTFGVITLVTTIDSGRYLSQEDVALAEELGRMAALAVDNAKLYEQTEAQRERFEVTLRSIGDAVIAADAQGVIELMTPVAEQLTGWKQTEAIGNPVSAVFKIVDESISVKSEPPTGVASPEPANLAIPNHTLLIKQRGQAIPIEHNASPIKDRHGNLTGEVLVFRDISERRRAERERLQLTRLLEAERRRLRNILENVPGMVWEGDLISENQALTYVNNYAEKLLGYSAADWMTIPGLGRQIIYPDDLATFIQQLRDTVERGQTAMTLRLQARAKDGRLVPIETYLTVTQDAAANPTVAYGLIMDITQRLDAENALRQYAHDLKRSNEELEQFAYVASHDLQEPLRMVTSYLQLLEQRYDSLFDKDAHEFINFAVDGATRMKALINDLLAYSRVKTDKRNFVSFTANEALTLALANLRTKIEDSQAQIISESLPTLMGNKNQFVQLFQNLISNAIKFRGESAPHIHISANRSGDDWVFAVQDNGIGIESQYLDRIFLMFQRLHPVGTYQGSGIGLTICKKVVEHHRGRIWAESKPGEGSTFYFTVPADANPH